MKRLSVWFVPSKAVRY